MVLFFFFKQKTAYEMRISDWSSDVCSSDLPLDMQRLLYIAQVEHIGQFAAPIFPDIFNATSLGPIIPRLMPLLKRKKAIAAPIHATILSQPMMMTLNRIAGEYGHLTSAQFVAVTHDDIGAWANYYMSGECRCIYNGRRIPIDALDDE